MGTYDVVALGELLIDFTPSGVSTNGSPLFECNPGGAPANVLTAVARQGGKAAFIGKVGKDSFGEFLKTTLEKENIATKNLVFDQEVRTTLAFVTLDDTGNRSFSFFRNPGADIMLRVNEIDTESIENTKVFHFGSLSCTHEPSRTATRYAVEKAKESGAVISYDPNLRRPLWKNEDTARRTILEFMPYADIVKISEEEFLFLTGEEDYQTHAAEFAEKYAISVLLVTLGPKGAFYYADGKSNLLPTYDVKVVDTTGSGDSFMGAVLCQIAQQKKELGNLTEEELNNIIDYANASGSAAASVKGGIPSIPTKEQVLKCRNEIPILRL